jgi:hypothetical protein
VVHGDRRIEHQRGIPKDLTWTPGGYPAVVHRNVAGSALYLSEWNGASWTKATRSGNTMIERRIIVRPNGQPFVAGRESSSGVTVWQRGVKP